MDGGRFRALELQTIEIASSHLALGDLKESLSIDMIPNAAGRTQRREGAGSDFPRRCPRCHLVPPCYLFLLLLTVPLSFFLAAASPTVSLSFFLLRPFGLLGMIFKKR